MNIKSTVLSALLLSGMAFGFTSAEAGDRFSVHSCRTGDSIYHHGSRHSWLHYGYRYPRHDYGHGYRHGRGHQYGHYRQAERGKHPVSRDDHRHPYRDDHGQSRGQAHHGERRHG
jgi:hypothetical protein